MLELGDALILVSNEMERSQKSGHNLTRRAFGVSVLAMFGLAGCLTTKQDVGPTIQAIKELADSQTNRVALPENTEPDPLRKVLEVGDGYLVHALFTNNQEQRYELLGRASIPYELGMINVDIGNPEHEKTLYALLPRHTLVMAQAGNVSGYNLNENEYIIGYDQDHQDFLDFYETLSNDYLLDRRRHRRDTPDSRMLSYLGHELSLVRHRELGKRYPNVDLLVLRYQDIPTEVELEGLGYVAQQNRGNWDQYKGIFIKARSHEIKNWDLNDKK